jgi:sporulation protein YlmC with PRC-barrel domain
LRAARDLCGLSVHGNDGRVGRIDDLYFDDEKCGIRYVVVNTGTWIFGRRKLISPTELREPPGEPGPVSVALTRDEIGRCPDAVDRRPVSRQLRGDQDEGQEWFFFWSPRSSVGSGPVPLSPLVLPGWWGQQGARREGSSSGGGAQVDEHLRSTREVVGYHVQATDGEVGHVEDILLSGASWLVRYVLVDTGNWWGGKKVVVEPEWVENVDCGESRLYVELNREGVEGFPGYDPDLC